MGLFDIFKRNSTSPERQAEAESDDFRLTMEQTDAIMEKMNRLTARKAFRLTLDDNREPSLFDSKFGGLPYWDSTKEYPTDMGGEKLMLLAQINLDDIGENDLLPPHGLLQFFIRRDDDLYGCDFSDGTGSDGYAVVWHETIDRGVTTEDVQAMDIPSSAAIGEEDILTPITGQAAVNVESTEVSMGMEVYGFEELFRQTAAGMGIILPEDASVFLSIPDEWHNEHPNPNAGHWMMGYPFFTQFDPRYKEELRRFDTLLLQIDSDYRKDSGCEVMWGDAGVGSFFINAEDLRNRDFSRVMYTWDCG